MCCIDVQRSSWDVNQCLAQGPEIYLLAVLLSEIVVLYVNFVTEIYNIRIFTCRDITDTNATAHSKHNVAPIATSKG